MIDAIALPVERFKSINQIVSRRFQVVDVPAGSTSDVIRLAVDIEGMIRTVRLANNSENYDISVWTKSDTVIPSVDQIYKVVTINKEWAEDGLQVLYSNNDATEQGFLYLVLTNNDPLNSTGIFELELIISQM